MHYLGLIYYLGVIITWILKLAIFIIIGWIIISYYNKITNHNIQISKFIKTLITKILQWLTIKRTKLLVQYTVIFLIGFYTVIFGYSYIFEQDKIAIDNYNLSQLEKAKPILELISKTDKKFYSLKEFNKQYNANIKPIKNCYYVSNSNGNEKYIFGFQLESKKYINKYGDRNYAYPKYDMPVQYFCGGSSNCDDDIIFGNFHKTISNPCGD